MKLRLIVILFLGIVLCQFIHGQDTQPPCSELELADFPEKVVYATFKKFKIPQNQWFDIYQELLARSKKVNFLMEQKGTKLKPNPFNPPRQQLVIAKIYKDTLREIFTEVMRDYGVEDGRQIYEMFDDILYEKAEIYWKCHRRRE